MPDNLIRTTQRNGGRHDPIDLPLVIRPQPLCLSDIERRLRMDGRFARALDDHPELRLTLARAIWTRDAAARTRFADPAALAEHLATVLAG